MGIMRYAVHHKQQSRQRILHQAAKQFRARGIEAVRVADVMQAAGLTHGVFYKHFADKDQLLREAVQVALEQIADSLKDLVGTLPRTEALRKVIATYLSEDHMQNPGSGCALAALGTELAHMPPPMRQAVSEALDEYAAKLDFLMPGETAAQRRAAFLVLFPSMAGCIMTARADANTERRKQILAVGRAFFEQAFCTEPTPAFLEIMQ